MDMQERHKCEAMNEVANDTSVRLNKYLAMHLPCSRREADRLIEEGRVLVDDETARQGIRVTPAQKIMVDGREIGRSEEMPFVLLAVNKPVGVVCSSDRRWDDRLLEDILPEQIRQKYGRLFPLGRLDKSSEGLILMTNNGQIVNPVMRGSAGHEKEYVVRLREEITSPFLQKLREGIFLEELGVTTRKCSAWRIDRHTFGIVLTQGLNRQIRRMCAACEMHVLSLKRIRVMNILLGDLAPGACRIVTAKEWELLAAKAGLDLAGMAGTAGYPGENNWRDRSGTDRNRKDRSDADRNEKDRFDTDRKVKDRFDTGRDGKKRYGADRDGKKRYGAGRDERKRYGTDR